MASSTLYIKLFNQFKEITDNARSMISRHIYPILEGGKPRESDAKLTELYKEWQAACRASAAALERPLYPNEGLKMPVMPPDDEEHQLCRQMAAVLIERTIYDEHTASRWFSKAAEAIKSNPVVANHPSRCACKKVLKGWTNGANQLEAQLLDAFYDAHYDVEKNEDYLQAVRDIAETYGITFEQQMVRERAQRENIKRREQEEREAKCLEIRKDSFVNVTEAHPNPIDSLLNAARNADEAILAAGVMPGGDTLDGQCKNLFKTLQGVNYDDKCPHGLPFYACMPCSH